MVRAAAWGTTQTQALGQVIADLKFGEALAQLDRQVPPAASPDPPGGAAAPTTDPEPSLERRTLTAEIPA